MNRFQPVVYAALLGVLPLLAFGCTKAKSQIAPSNLARADAATAGVAASALQTQFDARGLIRLSYNGTTLTDVAADSGAAFSVGDVHFLGAKGNVVSKDSGTARRSWDAARKTLTLAYDWGKVICQYEVQNDRLDLNITVENTGTQTLAGLNLFPLAVQFSGFPKGFDGSTPHVNFNLDGPTVQSADFGAGRLTIVNRGVTKPLAVGFITTSETAKNFRYNIYVGSAPLWYQPDNWPKFTRPIAPGARDEYRISLRFAPAKSDKTNKADSMGADVTREFAAAHAATLNWSDRRPMGALFLSSADNHPTDNPRGWFNNDKSVDVTSAAGRAKFRQHVLDYARASVTELRKVGAQGAITWDIEGQQYPHATSYIGDPRLLAKLAPEMDAVADDYFRVFKDAGLKVGICVRPQQLTFDAAGVPDQKEVADPAAILIDKIGYAKKRWGATLFYVDSNGGPFDPTDAEVFARVAAKFPDVLLMPEHQTLKYQAYTAPYNDLRYESGTSDEARSAYPRAFSVIKGDVAELTAQRADLVRDVRNGDVLIFNAWYDSEEGQLVKSIYKEAGAK